MSAHLYSLPPAVPTTDAEFAAPVPPIEAVLFDFVNTLFRMLPTEQFLARIWERAGHGPHADSGDSGDSRESREGGGESVGSLEATAVAEQVRAAGLLPHVIAAQHGRDTSARRHRDATLAWFAEVPAFAGIEEIAYEAVLEPGSWYPYTDTEPVLRALAERGIGVGVVSDIPFDLRVNVAAHGLGELIGAYSLSYELGCEKPDPRMFLKACADLGADPRRTLMVGDNPARDGGAVACNLRVLLLPAEPRDRDRGLDAVLRLVD